MVRELNETRLVLERGRQYLFLEGNFNVWLSTDAWDYRKWPLLSVLFDHLVLKLAADQAFRVVNLYDTDEY